MRTLYIHCSRARPEVDAVSSRGYNHHLELKKMSGFSGPLNAHCATVPSAANSDVQVLRPRVSQRKSVLSNALQHGVWYIQPPSSCTVANAAGERARAV